jgi:hypothetical protein
MWMTDPHVISALREKRARVSAIVTRLERQLDQQRADLSHIDGVLRLFAPDADPELIRPKRTYTRRTRYFAKGELARLCREAFRDAESDTLATDDIAGRVIGAKRLDAADSILRSAIRDQILTTLRALRKRGTVEQMGLGRGVRWKLAKTERDLL